jgi:TonB family protein
MTTPPEEAESPDDEVIPETTVPQTMVEPPPAVVAPPAANVSASPSSIMFGISSGSFASFGDGLSLREDIRPYFLEILERINTAWQQEGKGVKLTAPAMLLISIERAGELNNVQILQSSGNQLHDRLLARAVAKAAPFPAVPESFNRRTFETPIRFTPPLSLMSFDTPQLAIPQH